MRELDRYFRVVKAPDPYMARHLYRHDTEMGMRELDRYFRVVKAPDHYMARHLDRHGTEMGMRELPLLPSG